MRILLAALVILNIAFFAWHYAHKESGDGAKRIVVANAADIPSLVLLSERGAHEVQVKKKIQVVRDKQQDEQQNKPVICYRVGPFRNKDQLKNLAIETILPNSKFKIEEETSNQRSGYWVRWPEEMTLAEARRVMRELKGKGVTDLTITPQDNKRYAISLGIFGSRYYMELRVDEITALGYTPVVEDRYKRVIIYWLEFDISDTSIIDKLNLLVQKIQGAEVVSEAC